MDSETTTIELTSEQLRLLTEVMYIAHWVVCAGETCPNKEFSSEVEELEQTIYQQSLQKGNSDLVTFEEDLDRFFASRYVEENSRAWQAIEAHEEETFWEEFINRLSSIYATQECTPLQWNNLSDEERLTRMADQEENIRTILSEEGLRSVILMPDDHLPGDHSHG